MRTLTAREQARHNLLVWITTEQLAGFGIISRETADQERAALPEPRWAHDSDSVL